MKTSAGGQAPNSLNELSLLARSWHRLGGHFVGFHDFSDLDCFLHRQLKAGPTTEGTNCMFSAAVASH